MDRGRARSTLPASRQTRQHTRTSARSTIVQSTHNTTHRSQHLRAIFVAVQCPRTGMWLISRCEGIQCTLAKMCLCTSLEPKQTREEAAKKHAHSRRSPCKKCGATEQLTWHHVYPRRHFRHDRIRMRIKVSLCRPCHDEIERIIPYTRLHPQASYLGIVHAFIRNMTYTVVWK